MQGMRSFVRSHRKDLDRERTRFVSFESVGRGEPRFALSGGLAVSLPLDPQLAELCAASRSPTTGDAIASTPSRSATPGRRAAFVARAYRYPAIAITCREPRRGAAGRTPHARRLRRTRRSGGGRAGGALRGRRRSGCSIATAVGVRGVAAQPDRQRLELIDELRLRVRAAGRRARCPGSAASVSSMRIRSSSRASAVPRQK